jgi:disulfide bond formation protein DsbB
MAQPIVRCDAVVWSLAGISMAGYNMLASAALGAYALWAAARLARRTG